MNRQIVQNNKIKTFPLFLRDCVYAIAGFLNVIFSMRNPQVVVYCYHSISNDGWRFSVTEDMFKKQMEILLKWGIPITVRDLEAYVKEEKKLTKNAFLITFDDGYEDILTVKDFLKQKNIFPIAFVISNSDKANRAELETDRSFLSHEQIKELKRSGWNIGSHSATHPYFKKISGAEIIRETQDSKIQLEKFLSFSVDAFAYPKGVYTKEIIQLVHDANYHLAFSMDDGYVTEKTNRFAIPRVGVDGTHTLKQFRNLALPLSMFVRKVIKTSM